MRVPSPDELMAEVTALASEEHLSNGWLILRELIDFARPPEQISTVECAERYRRLKTPRGAGTIAWSRELTPYAVGIMDALDDPAVQEVIVPKPGRCGGTVAFECFAFRLMMFGPMPDIGWYLKADNQVDKYCDREWRYLFDLHPQIKARIGDIDNKSRKRIDGRLFEVQAAIPANFTNTQYGFMMGDEIDSYAPRIRASFLEQTRIRGRALGSQRKVGMTSHPDGGWAEGISPAWAVSSRGIFVWPCNNCGRWSSPFPTKFWPDVPRCELTWEKAGEQASKDERVEMAKATAELTCPHCSGNSGLDDRQRHQMIDAGQWMHRGQWLDVEIGICGDVEPNRSRGFWIHGTMSKMVTNAELAEEFEGALATYDSTRNSEKLREVISKVFGEPYEGVGEAAKLDAAELLKRRRDAGEQERGFNIGSMPKHGPLFLTQAVDVGHAKFDIGLWGWDLQGRSWMIDRKTIRQRTWPDGQVRDIRPTENILDWQVLVAEIDRLVPIAGLEGWAMPVAVTLIDSGDGNVTWKAYEFCRQMAGRRWGNFARVKPIKGNPSAKAPEIPVSGTRISRDELGAPVTPQIMMMSLGVHNLRVKALDRLATEDGGPGECFFAEGISRRHIEEFFGERLIDGKWVRSGDNESLDLFGYAEAGRQMLGPDRPSIEWQNPNGLPLWARPVSLMPKGGDPAAGARREISLLERFARLNEDQD